jgi:hypothetical protein
VEESAIEVEASRLRRNLEPAIVGRGADDDVRRRRSVVEDAAIGGVDHESPAAARVGGQS